jgi:hypothetical protein
MALKRQRQRLYSQMLLKTKPFVDVKPKLSSPFVWNVNSSHRQKQYIDQYSRRSKPIDEDDVNPYSRLLQGLQLQPEDAYRDVDAFFSDDGQRGIRYTPLFANSGFYYIKST